MVLMAEELWRLNGKTNERVHVEYGEISNLAFPADI